MDMATLDTTTCDGCKQRVRWLVNDHTGKRAPIHAVQRDDGNIVLLDADTYHVLTKADRKAITERPLFDDRTYLDNPRYVTHFAVCPRADKYRRRDPKSRQSQAPG
jgi:hypothetical protein